MVETQEIRDAFAARLNRALDDRPEVRKGRGRNVDMHAALKRFGVEATTQGTNKWLRAESMPEKDKMRQLAAWLGVRAQWLEYGEGEMKDAGRSDGARESTSIPPTASNEVAESRASYKDGKYQSATPEHRQAVDDLVDQLLDLSPEQALKIKQAMELLMPTHDPRKG
jgi:hypothetical protein